MFHRHFISVYQFCIGYIYDFVSYDGFLDPFEVLMGSVLSVATNFTLLSQIVMYQRPAAGKEKKMK